MSEQRYPIFGVCYEEKGKQKYSMIRAPNPEEAIKRFHKIWNNTRKVTQVAIMNSDGLLYEINDSIKKQFNW